MFLTLGITVPSTYGHESQTRFSGLFDMLFARVLISASNG